MTYSTKFREEPIKNINSSAYFIAKDENDYAYLKKDKNFCLVSSHDEISTFSD